MADKVVQSDDSVKIRKQLNKIMELARNFRTSRVITTSVEKEILERFTEPAKPDDVTGDNEKVDPIRRFVRLLTGLGLLEKTPDGKFVVSELTKRFLLPNSPYDLRPVMSLFHRNYDLWTKLPEVFEKEHEIENEAFGDIEFGPDFMLSMETRAHFAKKDVAEAIQPLVDENDRIIDLGGGTGVFIREILRQTTGSQAVLADLDHVVETAEKFTRDTGVENRISFYKLDFFETKDYGNNFDIALLFSICHMFNEEKNKMLLNRTGRCLADDGILIIRDYVLNEDGVGPLESNFFDLHMILATEDGRTYTIEEFRELLQETGFEFSERKEIPGHDDLIIANKS